MFGLGASVRLSFRERDMFQIRLMIETKSPTKSRKAQSSLKTGWRQYYVDKHNFFLLFEKNMAAAKRDKVLPEASPAAPIKLSLMADSSRNKAG